MGTRSEGPAGPDVWREETTNVEITDLALSAPAGRDAAYLIVLAGSRAGEMIRLDVDREVVLGRGDDAGFRLADTGVSRAHIGVTARADGTVLLEDKGSRNGTFVNGVRADKGLLRDGDKIQLGSTAILKFSYADTLEAEFQKSLYEAALKDPLTRLFNRRHMVEQLPVEIRYAVRHASPLSFMLIDVDHFKRVNDTYGHPVGDAMLAGFGELLRSIIRTEDIAARFGGEEFALLCRTTGMPGAMLLAERVRKMAERATLVALIPQLKITVSIGVAVLEGTEEVEPNTLVTAADNALYEAKAAGRNRVVLSTEVLRPGPAGGGTGPTAAP